MSERSVDPITTEVVWNKLTSYANEMATVLERSAYSPMITDVKDRCAALVDLDGRVLGYNQGGLPTHFSDIGEDTVDGLDVYGEDGFDPGDVVVMNAQYYSGQHANNVLVYSPIFHEGELVAFAGTRAHWSDIGGITANRPVFGTTEAVQEGLQVRSVKVYREGEPVEDVLRLIRENLRQPDISLGDLRAQVGACRIGEQRFSSLLDEYSLETVIDCVEEQWRQSAQLAADAVAEMPDGVYTAESMLDTNGYDHDETVPIEVAVEVDGDRMHVDLSDLADQVKGPLNSNTVVPIQIAFKALTTPRRLPDEGCFEPLSIELPPGTILSAEPPAAMGSWSWPFPTVIDTIFRALAPAIPDKVAAGNSGMGYGAGFFYGADSDDGSQFVSSDILQVGWGGRPDEDGVTSLGMFAGDLQDTPSEVTESSYPIRVERYEFREGSAGAGRYRGGFGVAKEYTLLEDAFNNGEIDRVKMPAWGLFGGTEGTPARNTMRSPDGDATEYHHSYMNEDVAEGASVIVRTGGGGGYGDPFARDVERVRADVRDGYIAREEAREEYGVVVTEDGDVDEDRTAELRGESR